MTGPQPPVELVVSPGRGDDDTGDGSRARPFRTLVCGLRAVAGDPLTVHLEPGVYDSESSRRW